MGTRPSSPGRSGCRWLYAAMAGADSEEKLIRLKASGPRRRSEGRRTRSNIAAVAVSTRDRELLQQLRTQPGAPHEEATDQEVPTEPAAPRGQEADDGPRR